MKTCAIRTPDIGLPAAYPASVQAEAKHAALTNLEQFAAPVTEDVLRIWLAPIPVVVRNEKSPEAIAGWVAGVAMTVGHLEIGAFTDETQREALSTFKFFPAAADVYEIVAGPAVRIRETICHLRRVADAPTIDNAVKADTAGECSMSCKWRGDPMAWPTLDCRPARCRNADQAAAGSSRARLWQPIEKANNLRHYCIEMKSGTINAGGMAGPGSRGAARNTPAPIHFAFITGNQYAPPVSTETTNDKV